MRQKEVCMDISYYKQLPLTEVCKALGLTYVKHGYGGNYKVKDFGGLVIKDNFFYQHSTGEKGSVIDFVMLTQGCHFKEALSILQELFGKDHVASPPIQELSNPTENKREAIFEEPSWIQEPQIIEYLLTRKIDRQLIDEEIRQRRIQGVLVKGHLNVAFLCYDLENPVLVRGTIVRGIKEPFKGLLKGSNGAFGYWVPPNTQNVHTLYVFEAPIDLLSYLTLYGHDHTIGYVAMGGVKPHVITQLVATYNPSTIVCCTDNDEAGHHFFKQLQEQFSTKRLRRRVPLYKDWNEDLTTK